MRIDHIFCILRFFDNPEGLPTLERLAWPCSFLDVANDATGSVLFVHKPPGAKHMPLTTSYA